MPGTGNNLAFVIAGYSVTALVFVTYAIYVHRAVRAAKGEYDAATKGAR